MFAMFKHRLQNPFRKLEARLRINISKTKIKSLCIHKEEYMGLLLTDPISALFKVGIDLTGLAVSASVQPYTKNEIRPSSLLWCHGFCICFYISDLNYVHGKALRDTSRKTTIVPGYWLRPYDFDFLYVDAVVNFEGYGYHKDKILFENDIVKLYAQNTQIDKDIEEYNIRRLNTRLFTRYLSQYIIAQDVPVGPLCQIARSKISFRLLARYISYNRDIDNWLYGTEKFPLEESRHLQRLHPKHFDKISKLFETNKNARQLVINDVCEIIIGKLILPLHIRYSGQFSLSSANDGIVQQDRSHQPATFPTLHIFHNSQITHSDPSNNEKFIASIEDDPEMLYPKYYITKVDNEVSDEIDAFVRGMSPPERPRRSASEDEIGF